MLDPHHLAARRGAALQNPSPARSKATHRTPSQTSSCSGSGLPVISQARLSGHAKRAEILHVRLRGSDNGGLTGRLVWIGLLPGQGLANACLWPAAHEAGRQAGELKLRLAAARRADLDQGGDGRAACLPSSLLANNAFDVSDTPMRIPPDGVAFTMLLGSLAALPALSIDVSAPTLVLLPAALTMTEAAAGVTLSLFMAGFAVGQLLGGYVSDRRGRRPVLTASLLCFTLAAAGCAMSQSAGQLLAFRLLQGIGAGSCSVLAFAMIQDLFVGHRARSKRSYVAVVFAIMPMVAPALGIWLIAIGACNPCRPGAGRRVASDCHGCRRSGKSDG